MYNKIFERAKKNAVGHFRFAYYSKKSTNTWKNIKKILLQKIPEIEVNHLIERLYTYHPWMKHYDKYFAESFLYHYLKERIIFSLRPPNLSKPFSLLADNSPTDEDLDKLENGQFEFKSIEDEEEEFFLLHYPLMGKDLLIHITPSSHLSYSSSIQKYCEEKTLQSPTRLDILSFLSHENLIRQKDKFLLAVMPAHIDELTLVMSWKKEELRTIFVNIAEENKDPLWVIFNKSPQDDKWTAYLPGPGYIQLIQSKKLPPEFSSLQFDYLPYQDQNNFIKRLETPQDNALSLWHAVLLGRIWPWLKSKNEAQNHNPPSNSPCSFEQYRKKVPLVLLYQYLLEGYQIYSGLPISFYPTLERERFFLPHTKNILESFDCGRLNIDDRIKTLTYNDNEKYSTFDLIDQAACVLYHTPQIERFIFSNSSKKIARGRRHPIDPIERLLIENFSLKIVKPADNNSKSLNSVPLLASIAARNRFLEASFNSSELKEIKKSTADNIEEITALIIAKLFTEDYYPFNLEFIKHFLQLDNTWRNNFYDINPTSLTSAKEVKAWKFAQITQLGELGLVAFFSDKIFKEKDGHTAPFPGIFDLNGSMAEGPQHYIQVLKNQIEFFLARSPKSVPLFSTLSFILPPFSDRKSQYNPGFEFNKEDPNFLEFLELIRTWNKHQENHPEDAQEITLYNLPPGREMAFLNYLYQEIEKNKLSIRFLIPDLEHILEGHQKTLNLKKNYNFILNEISKNNRKKKILCLHKNTEEPSSPDSNSPLLITEAFENQQEEQQGEDVCYLLSQKASYGLQQHLEQGEQVAQALNQQQQQALRQETSLHLDQYRGDIDSLISRDTIDTSLFASECWREVNEKTKQTYGWTQKISLSSLFSLWVGSKQSARWIINKITPSALREIMHNASLYRMGISLDHLPPGFSLSSSPNNPEEIVLCFDHQLKKMQEESKLTQDAFQIKPPYQERPIPFHGDYRQFEALAPDSKEQVGLWQSLVQPRADHDFFEKAQAYGQKNSLGELTKANCSSLIAYYQLTGNKFNEKDIQDLNQHQAAKNWLEKELPSDLFQALWVSLIKLNLRNFKALGQVFQYYGTQGLKQFFMLMEKMFLTNPQNFAIWKWMCLDASSNWAEVLRKPELQALEESMKVFKENPTVAVLWCSFAKTHYRATGSLNYTNLWNAFHRVLEAISEQHLSIETTVFEKFLEETQDFNGVVFLERLHYLLKNTEAPQEVLNNINKIDWSSNGAYYAIRYENYPYWDEELKLTQFQPENKYSEPSYRMNFYHNDMKTIPMKTLLLRFGSHYKNLNYSAFVRLKNCIEKLTPSTDEALFYCLLVVVFFNPDEFNEKNLISIQNEINAILQIHPMIKEAFLYTFKYIFSDSHNTPPSKIFCLSLKDIRTLGEALSEANPLEQPRYIKKYCIALHVYKKWEEKAALEPGKTVKDYLKELYNQCSDTQEDSPLLNYPWVLFDMKKELDAFLKLNEVYSQKELRPFIKLLTSVDIQKSHYFPSIKELLAYAEAIKTNTKSAQKIAQELIENGFYITDIKSNQGIEKRFNHFYPQDREYAYQKFNAICQPQFQKANQALFKCLLDSLAHLPRGDATELFNQLMEIFSFLDKNPYYNQLGQVLGLLLQGTKPPLPQSKREYSLLQLIKWLNALKTKDSQGYYPLDLLKEVVTQKKASSLLHDDLDELEEENPSINSVASIMETKLPQSYRSLLIKWYLKDPDTAKESYQERLLGLEQSQATLENLVEGPELVEKLLEEEPHTQELVMSILYQVPAFTQEFPALAAKTQSILARLLIKEKQIPEGLRLCFSPLSSAIRGAEEEKASYIKAILTQAISDWNNDNLFTSLYKALQTKTCAELKTLLTYYASGVSPSAPVLSRLLASTNSIPDLIHRFETVEQALDDQGRSIRNYAISAEDNQNLQRILSEIKYKGEYLIPNNERKELTNLLFYMNYYAQFRHLDQLTSQDLQNELDLNLAELENASKAKQKQVAARILACLRELLVRKLGKWATPVQMLTALLQASHEEESLIYQLKTGEGKGMVTALCSIYLALTNHTVDVFSAKESLSKRDHEEFRPVLDSLKIKHAFIHEHSNHAEYQAAPKKGTKGAIGTIHYTTSANLSLFLSKHSWEGNPLNLGEAEQRIGWVDEGDHLLKDEHTQFNYSHTQGTYFRHNMDAWVYEAVYLYYLEHKESFIKTDRGLVVSRNKHLQALSKQLLQKSCFAPKESTFIATYLAPASDKGASPADLEKRDLQLKRLLSAAHLAHSLKEDKQYCIMPEKRFLTKDIAIDTRFAKVVIDNQVRHGSTYSDLVQQFLHTRLNQEAVQKGETPNFFIEPDSEIVLSLNTFHLLKNHYAKLFACTGTAGNAEVLRYFKEHFNIQYCIKLPTQKEVKTTFLEPIYCDSQAAQVDHFVKEILTHSDQPILITCRDDSEVKQLSAAIRQRLPIDKREFLLIDTNDSGQEESDILGFTGKCGAVTISSRLGRGTDIKPESQKGLRVLRSYAAPPSIAKQERGRQGRNGAPGTCQDIINIAEINAQYLAYKTSHPLRLEEIELMATKHLEAKAAKHQRKGSQKWDWVEQNSQKKINYLIARTVVQLNEEIKEQEEKELREKENRIAYFSDCVRITLETHPALAESLKIQWLSCRKNIEDAWNSRSKLGVKTDFNDISNHHWQILKGSFSELMKAEEILYNASLKKPLDSSSSPSPSPEEPHVIKEELAALLPAYQALISFLQEHVEWVDKQKITMEDMDPLWHMILDLSNKGNLQQKKEFFEGLSKIFKKKSFYGIPYSTLHEIFETGFSDEVDTKRYWLCLIQLMEHPFIDSEQISLSPPKKSYLLKLTMAFVLKQNPPCPSFVNNFLSAMQPLGGNFKEYSLLLEYFASDTKMATWLSHANQTELSSFMKQVSLEKDLTISIQKIKTNLLPYIHSLDETSLTATSTLLDSFTRLALTDSFLPKRNSLKELGIYEIPYIQFLAQRAPITQAQYEKLTAFLMGNLNLPSFTEEILKPLLKLPSCIPMEIILEKVLPPGKELKLKDSREVIRQLNNIGTAILNPSTPHSPVLAYPIKEILQDSLTILHDVQTLSEDGKEVFLQTYFADFHSNQRKRLKLLQFLYHNIIPDENGLKEACFESYRNLFTTTPKTSAEFAHLARELREIVHPSKEEGSKNFTKVALENKRDDFIKIQEQSYAKMWFVSSLRREQARGLFFKLNEINASAKNDAGAKYYETILGALFNTQQSILRQDKKTKNNKKGYSRLYDITTVIFMKYAEDLLSNRAIPLDEKYTVLHNAMSKQAQTNLHLFASRIVKESSLSREKKRFVERTFPTKYSSMDSTLSSLPAVHTWLEENRGLVPNHLLYLVKNIDGLIELSDKASEQEIKLR